MINPEVKSTLEDIFSNTEREDKIIVKLNEKLKTMTVIYEDLDDEWFREVETGLKWGGNYD